jgi:hypothetical protein
MVKEKIMKKVVLVVIVVVVFVVALAGVAYAAISARSKEKTDPNNEKRDEFESVIEGEKETDTNAKLKEVPIYKEYDLLFNTDGSFYLNRDACFYEGQNARQNYTGGILEAYPTDAIRDRNGKSVYLVYDTDTGYRLYLFVSYDNDLQTPIGFPVVIGKMLSYDAFCSLNLGDPIEKVEAIDSVATLHKKLIIDVWNLDPVGAANHAIDGYPCTSIHYLKDGLLKIEYKMLENQDLVISDIEFSEDYTLINALGDKVDYKINELDLPG